MYLSTTKKYFVNISKNNGDLTNPLLSLSIISFDNSSLLHISLINGNKLSPNDCN